MAPEVRELDQRDLFTAARITALQRVSYEQEAKLIGFDAIPPLRESAEDVSALHLTMLGVEDELGELCAILGFARTGDTVGIDRLAVRPDRFRTGLARLLLEHLHDREDARRFEVSTGADNLPAVRLYLSMGYEATANVALPQGLMITLFSRTAC
ncbi:MAG TPA: GNAT family N-acetyltransferase [Actinomycetota bacterium]|nr:GNAT family N-acetyltransferase [Actinomycetota bacterium]